MSCSVRQSQQELVSVYLWGLLCQLLDEFAAVEAAVEVTGDGTAFSTKERLRNC